MKMMKLFGMTMALVALALIGANAATSDTAPLAPQAATSSILPSAPAPAYVTEDAAQPAQVPSQALMMPIATATALTVGFNPANVQTISGTQQPIRTTIMSNGRLLKYYTAKGEESVTHEKCVILSIQRGTNTWWDRRILRFRDLNELNPCAAEGGCLTTEAALRSFLGDVFDAIQDAVDTVVGGLTGFAHQFADILRTVGELFTKWGKTLTETADAIDKNAAAFYAKAVTEVAPNSTMLTHVKLQRAWNKAIALDPSGKTALVLATSTLNLP